MGDGVVVEVGEPDDADGPRSTVWPGLIVAMPACCESLHHGGARRVAEIAGMVVGDADGDNVERLQPVDGQRLGHRQRLRTEAGRQLRHGHAFEIDHQRAAFSRLLISASSRSRICGRETSGAM